MNMDQARKQIQEKLSEELAALGFHIEISGGLNNMGGVDHLSTALLYLYDTTNTVCGSLRLTDMPGCCGVFVASALYVNEVHCRQGAAQLLLASADIISRCARVGMLTGTALDETRGIAKLLGKCGWAQGVSFVNGRSDNPITVWFKRYTYEENY